MMESKNALLAILLSMVVLFGYQLLFPPQHPEQPATPPPATEQATSTQAVQPSPSVAPYPEAVAVTDRPSDQDVSAEEDRPGRDIQVTTKLYSAVVSESGGTVKSFRLNDYREDIDPDSARKELVGKVGQGRDLPLFFSWGADPATIVKTPIFESSQTKVATGQNGKAELIMTGQQPGGLTVTRAMTFNDENYLLDLIVEVTNNSDTALQGAPYLSLPGRPFSTGSKNSRLFNGPAVLINGSLEEVKVKKLKENGTRNIQGDVTWTAYEDTYFMMAVAPEKATSLNHTVRLNVADDEKVENVLFGPSEVIAPGSSKQYRYVVYIGPKKMTALKAADHDFDQAINFGWFGFVAKPVLVLLNLIYKYIHNYGVAIILVTVLIKLFFWPITQKGMKSMKNMQKLQPKLAKIREKYKDDKERLAQEQMKMYQTHKINPLGGCLPMVLQIPVFFALYRVLMQAIELRHAPFMLWITDLSAPERLNIGFQLPYVGGLPLLTLLMGGSMFLQQKMTPTQATNPEMGKMMMMMPVVFTFIFINFASGLVLYFCVNNLLQMAQQYFINKDRN